MVGWGSLHAETISGSTWIPLRVGLEPFTDWKYKGKL